MEVFKLLQSTPHHKLCKVLSRGYGGDMSLFVDIKAEEIFIKYLSRYGTIFSEESGKIDQKSPYTIILDPIDGSDNFKNNIPYYGSSISLQKENKTIKSIICNYANGDIFIKFDKHLYHSSLFLQPTNIKSFKKVKENIFSSMGIFEKEYKSKKISKLFKKESIKYRSLGAVALSLAYARYVDFVLFEGDLRAFDIDAGMHMCSKLNLIKTKKYLFVSKDKQIFDRICKNILKAG